MTLVVNMIPKSLSDETNQDSEPMLAVNPANPQLIVGTAFTPDPMGGALAPIYLSQDGGNTWRLDFIVPSHGPFGTGDITVGFAGASSALYASILRIPAPPNQTQLNILRTLNYPISAPMKVLTDRLGVDQPFMYTLTAAAGAGTTRDRLYVGDNDFGALGGRTATLEISKNAKSGTGSIRQIRLETRGTAGQDGPQIRPTAHSDGTVYVAYYGWRSTSGNFSDNTLRITSDVVVARDDRWGDGSKPFQALIDPADGLPGMRVARGVRFPFNRNGRGGLGQQRLGGGLSIAVDPRASGTIYLAWADEQQGVHTIHVRRSTDRGVSWSPTDLRTISSGINPAIAINSQGTVGLLYQRLTRVAGIDRWETHVERTSDGTNWTDLVLATTPAQTPLAHFDPYLGDYAHMVAAGTSFYGIFSANNTPDKANFPNGVTYLRNADFTKRKLLGFNNSTEVAVSIDPFFFKI